MTENSAPPSSGPFNRIRLYVALGVAVVVVAIAGWFVLGNGGAEAKECPVQAEEAEALAEAATGELAALNGTGEGRGYSTIAFTDEAGATKTLSEFKGKAMLVNFWASWCVPCREEMPALDALATKYNSDAFMVLPINTGEVDPAKARAFLDEGKFANLPLYEDKGLVIWDRLKRDAVVVGLPLTLLLDENGCELAVLPGPAHWNTPDGEKVIETLIGLKS